MTSLGEVTSKNAITGRDFSYIHMPASRYFFSFTIHGGILERHQRTVSISVSLHAQCKLILWHRQCPVGWPSSQAQAGPEQSLPRPGQESWMWGSPNTPRAVAQAACSEAKPWAKGQCSRVIQNRGDCADTTSNLLFWNESVGRH